MSFEDEWAQHKAAAAEKHSTKMQLNQHMADPGGSGDVPGDLAVAQKDLAAIGDQAFKLYQRLNKDGDHAKASTEKAAGELKPDFALSEALSTLADKWNSQVDSLLQACGHISNHLDYTQKAHAGDEHYIATSFSVEQLGGGFDEGTKR